MMRNTGSIGSGPSPDPSKVLVPVSVDEVKRTMAFYGSAKWFGKLQGPGIAAEVLPRLPGMGAPSNPAPSNPDANCDKGPWVLMVLILTEKLERQCTCAAFPAGWAWDKCAEVALQFSNFAAGEIGATRQEAMIVPMGTAEN